MRVRRSLISGVLTSVALIGCCAPFSGPAQAQLALDAAAISQLKAGEVVIDVRPDPQGATGLIRAVIDIPAAPQRVWQVMTDCERSKRTIPSLKTCRVMEQAADGAFDVREHVVQWIWPLPSVRSVFRSDYQPFQRIAFRKIEGDLELLEGDWQLVALSGGAATRLTYRARITPGWPVPGAMVRSAIEADVPKTLAALRREAVGGE
jgi:carbon monoxide dehydrogenase subunit G